MGRRKFKEIPEEDLQELHNFLEKSNKQESVLLSTLNVNVKCKTENQKKYIFYKYNFMAGQKEPIKTMEIQRKRK